ncbi:MAG: D-aminoacyl-tRNA deacylase [Candidatus Bathyarchaeia archaeon]
MRHVIAVSNRDPAGLNIKEVLITDFGFRKTGADFDGMAIFERSEVSIVTTKTELVNAEHLNSLEADLIIFASRHESVAGKPCFTVHTPGNWATAGLGGRTGELCISPAVKQTVALRELWDQASRRDLIDRYEVVLEATHHGPFLRSIPCFFIEIGSRREQWEDPLAARVIGDAIMGTIGSRYSPGDATIGVGGPHYSRKFSRMVLEDGVAMGHIVPKYVLPQLSDDMIRKAMDRVLEPVHFVTLDWKGLGRSKGRIVSCLKKLGVEWTKA